MAQALSSVDQLRARLAGPLAARRGDSGAGALTVTVAARGRDLRTLKLQPGTFLFARDPQADIVVMEMAADTGVRLRVHPQVAEGIDLVALGGGVTVDGRALPEGHPQRVKAPAEISIGDVTLTLKAIPVLGVAIPRNVKVFALLSVAAAALAMVLPSRLDPPLSHGPVSIAADAVSPRWTTAADATANARRVLSRLDLAQRVTAVEEGRGLRLTGEVGGSEVRRWQDALAMIRTRSEVPVTVAVQLDPSEGSAARAIAGVALAPEASVVARTGQRVRVGETLPNGWTVRDINDKRVVLERDGFSEAVSF